MTQQRHFRAAATFTSNNFTVTSIENRQAAALRFRRQAPPAGNLNCFIIQVNEPYDLHTVVKAVLEKLNTVAPGQNQYEASWQSSYYLRTTLAESQLTQLLAVVDNEVNTDPEQYKPGTCSGCSVQ